MVGNAGGTGGGASGRVHFRSQSGCCVCGTKSSSSRFIVSQRYSEHFTGCFGAVAANRSGDLCNACVLCVKRWLKADKQPGWFAQVLDSKKGPGPKHMKEITKRARRREARLAAGHAASTASPSPSVLGKSRQASANGVGNAPRRCSPGSCTNGASHPASAASTTLSRAGSALPSGHARHRHQTGASQVWPEDAFWRPTPVARTGYTGAAQKRADVQGNSADFSGVGAGCGAGMRGWSNGDNLNGMASSAGLNELLGDEKNNGSKVARVTSTRAATIRRLEAKSASAANSAANTRALSSSTPNRGGLHCTDLVPGRTGASMTSKTSDYGSGSSLSGCSSISSAFSASMSSGSCHGCCCCHCYCCSCSCSNSCRSTSGRGSCFSAHHRSASGVPNPVARGQQGTGTKATNTSAQAVSACKCPYAGSDCGNGGIRDTGEVVAYKRPRYDNSSGPGGREKQSGVVTRPNGNAGNYNQTKRPQTCDSSHTAYADRDTTRQDTVAFRKRCHSCCCGHPGSVTANSMDSGLSEFRLPPPPATTACDHVLRRHGNAGSAGLATGSVAQSASAAGAAGKTGACPQSSQKGSPTLGSATAPLGNGDTTAQSARRYNRRVILPPLRMSDTQTLDALYREIMDYNSQAVNFDSREMHMAVQYRLRQRNRLTANSATSGGGSLSGQATTSSSISSADGSSNLEHPSQVSLANGDAPTGQMGGPVGKNSSCRVDTIPAVGRQMAKRHHHHHYHHHKAA